MTEPLIVKLGKERYYTKSKTNLVSFTGYEEADKLLNDLTNYPHAFILACLMNRRNKAEKAWQIPYLIAKDLGDFSITTLGSKTLSYYQDLFTRLKLHNHSHNMASIFYKAVQKIITDYHGDVSLIWKNTPSSAKVIFELLHFEGCGPKIATMAANILARQFNIEFSDYYSIDISVDTHVRTVISRMYDIKEHKDALIIYKVRELYPHFPGIIDYTCWEVGRLYCHKKKSGL